MNLFTLFFIDLPLSLLTRKDPELTALHSACLEEEHAASKRRKGKRKQERRSIPAWMSYRVTDRRLPPWKHVPRD